MLVFVGEQWQVKLRVLHDVDSRFADAFLQQGEQVVCIQQV